MKNLLYLFYLFLPLSLGYAGSEDNPEQISSKRLSTTTIKAEIDSIVQHHMSRYEIPGLSIGVVSNDSIVYAKGYGVRNITTRELVTENSIFHAASISKLFTAHATINLIEAKQLNLHDKVVDLLPELAAKDRRFNAVTVATLLNHTSGLPDVKSYHWRNNNQAENALEAYILAQKFKLKSSPSESYRYSNLGFNLLGYIIQRSSQKPFEDYVASSILAPLKMVNSDFRYFFIPDSLKTSPHSRKGNSGEIYPRAYYPYTREHAPSSTLNTSSEELCYWMRFVLNDLADHGDSSKFHKMTQPFSAQHKFTGLGFQLYEVEGEKAIGHYGGDKGFRSYLVMIPEKQIGLCLLANCDYEEDFRQEILHTILSRLL